MMNAMNAAPETKTQLPPHDEAAEKAVLGGMLQSKDALVRALDGLRAGDFFYSRHRTIFSACESLHTQGQPVDFITVTAWNTTHHTNDEAGGIGYATSLVDDTPTAANIAAHIAIVKRASGQRRIIEECRRIAGLAALGNGTDPADLKAGLCTVLEDIDAGDRTPLDLAAPVAALRAMRDQGDPIPTGLPTLDKNCRGGLRLRRAVAIGGTAGSGKTSLLMQLALGAAHEGVAVACLMQDEGREAAIIRVGQQLGYDRDELENAHEGVLAALENDLATLALTFPDPDGEGDATIEGVCEALAVAYPGQPGMVVLDSIQTVQTRQGVTEFSSLRERIMENARTARRCAVAHNLLVIYTSEVNRSWYRARKEEDRASDLAAFAEARIEFSADVLVTMRAMEDDPDLVEIRVPKNRLGTRRGFLLRLDRARARFAEIDGGILQTARDAALTKKVEEASANILRVLDDHGELSRSQLWDEVRGNREAFQAALRELKASGIIVTEARGRGVFYRRQEIPT